MAKANTFLATDPNGKVHTRTSQNRTYTHCVAYLPDYELALAEAKRPSRVDESNYDYHVKGVAETYEQWITTRRWLLNSGNRTEADARAIHAEEVARHRKFLADATNLPEYLAARTAERVAQVEELKAGGYFNTWRVDGWQGRPDLAPKALASLRKRGSGGWFAISEAVILTVTKKEA